MIPTKIDRNTVLSRAVDELIKESYALAQPSVEWDDFVKQNEEYTKRYEEWENYNSALNDKEKYPSEWEKMDSKHPDWKDKRIYDCIGPRPFEFYYLPKEVLNDLVEYYVSAYKIESHEELTNIIELLQNYFENPIVDKYIDDWVDTNGNHHPGYRSYAHPDNMLTEISKILLEKGNIEEEKVKPLAEAIVNEVKRFMDMANGFYNFNRELNTFNMSVYLGPTPSSNKKSVIENWKKYRWRDIVIDDKVYEDDEDDEWYEGEEGEE